MLGDRLVICDIQNGRFYAGWTPKKYYDDVQEPVWTMTVDDARKTRTLGHMQSIAKTLGDGVRVVSETKARQIEMLRDYRSLRASEEEI